MIQNAFCTFLQIANNEYMARKVKEGFAANYEPSSG
jgi:hypothetical protein